ncbi:hypothetical protein NT01EI_0261 [Edwardsiella ictaluri 93-146]|uniref:Uncharacterized protein n=1 Tax=Edwardsiella ictaluri (strain 93-146) TaxID=634503 RepID=C5BCE1_EDWI9|nr:hypothetical protein NT01EI_0261 [Edwardsiella ictaluri 93-146]
MSPSARYREKLGILFLITSKYFIKADSDIVIANYIIYISTTVHAITQERL